VLLQTRNTDPENVTVVKETNNADLLVRYVLSLKPTAPREEIVSFYRMHRENVPYTDAELTWIYPDHVEDLQTQHEE